ncbi:YybH family protein [Silvimonas amylolytica]|uniref:Ketosteroid isomerase n=1 Tax=Silvimonas amylolytica TaxID=449663 RepID=A0ABQ2PMQ3_9NEIS|nr:SgcJ/EcaC family oxidoreductase [Silvimonas amylolytica]GGP26264.1 ketosteroid isomerase [Silvimonas amylolytica]
MTQSDESAIRALCSHWQHATAAGDYDSVLALMADDAIFITPGQPPIIGKSAFAALLPPRQAGIRIDTVQDIAEIVICADLAYARSHLEVTVRSPQLAQPVTRSGQTLTLYQRQADGRWLLLRDANTLLLDATSGRPLD